MKGEIPGLFGFSSDLYARGRDDAVLADLAAQGVLGDPQFPAGFHLFPAVSPESLLDGQFFHLFQGMSCRSRHYVAVAYLGFDKGIGQVLGLDVAAGTENKPVFDDVFQFPDIARKMIAHEQGNDLVADANDVFLFFRPELFDEVFDQQRNILQPQCSSRAVRRPCAGGPGAA